MRLGGQGEGRNVASETMYRNKCVAEMEKVLWVCFSPSLWEKKNIVYDKIGMAKLETQVLFYLQASYNIDNSQVDFFYAALQVNFTSKQTKQSCPLEVVLHLEAASAEGSAIMSTEQNCSDSWITPIQRRRYKYGLSTSVMFPVVLFFWKNKQPHSDDHLILFIW